MVKQIRLSELINEIEDTIADRFSGETFWITAEITDVKKQPDKRWCFLKFIEKNGPLITAEMRGVFWSNTYFNVDQFEKLSGQTFRSGLEITCNVRVRFHKRYGIDLEVLEIDHTYAVGKLELEKQQTLHCLLKENASIIRLVDEQYITANNQLPLPLVLQRIALITAPNSDGERDFKNEIAHNQYGYAFTVTSFLTQIQGDNASKLIIQKLQLIEARQKDFDVVVIVRGGGSQTDFKPFDNYELARYVAGFPLPVFTGIGHDRNTSIVDLMARQLKTPTKVAANMVDYNFNFESAITNLKERYFNAAANLLEDAQQQLQQIKRTVKAYSPTTILNKGYAMVMQDGKIVTNPAEIRLLDRIETVLQDEIIHSTVTQKTDYEPDL